VPALLTFIAETPMLTEEDLSCMDYIVVGAAPVGDEVFKRLAQKIPNLKLVEGKEIYNVLGIQKSHILLL